MEPIQVVTISVAQLEAILKRIIDRKLAKVRQPEQKKENERMNIKEIAEYLKIKPGTIYQLTGNRKIPHHKEGGRIIFFKMK